MGDRRPLHGDLDYVPLGGFDGLSDGLRDLGGFAETVADVTGAVADDDESREPRDAAALNRFGNAFCIDEGLFQLYCGIINLFSHYEPPKI